MTTFEYKPHANLEDYVRDQLTYMRKLSAMYAQSRGEFVSRVSTLLEVIGVRGPIFAHLANKKGCSIIKLSTSIDDEFAQETIDEAIAILDSLKDNALIERASFRLELKNDLLGT